NPNQYKYKLEEFVYDRYQRTLAIDGEIELSVFPRIGLSLSQVSLSERNSKQPFASLETARFAVAIWPLLFNKLVVDHVAIDGLHANLHRDLSGRFNFEDLIQAGTPDALPIALEPKTPFLSSAAAKNSTEDTATNKAKASAASAAPATTNQQASGVLAQKSAGQKSGGPNPPKAVEEAPSSSGFVEANSATANPQPNPNTKPPAQASAAPS